MNNFLVYLGIIAQLTGLTLPQILADDFYLLPNYSNEQTQLEARLRASDLPTAQAVKAPRSTSLNWGPENSSAKAAIIMDVETGQILWEKNSHQPYPIASLTKLMTSLIFLENNPGWDKTRKITASENSLSGAKLQIDNDQELTTTELLRVTLVGSANNTAKALARSTGLADDAFVSAMNEEAKILGLNNAIFTEPTGLDVGNQASASDLAVLFRVNIKHKTLLDIMSKKEHSMLVPPDNYEHTIKTTVKLLNDSEVDVLAGKTGFTYEAGYCLASLAQNKDKNKIIVIVLGLNSEASRDQETKKLINWAFNNYIWE
jgi:D-alanyl-D-alanine carboxypeptidase (penicillin-binding protein 5/6)